MSRIPNEITFGINSLNERIDYGYVRNVNDNNELIKLLRLRLKVFFIDQVQPLVTSRSAFPLTTMTCIGIETLGEIFITENNNDTSYQFVEITRKMHQLFGRNPNKKYQAKLKSIWSDKDLSKIDCYGKIFYRFFRNSMLHGYQCKGVFLSYEDAESFTLNETYAYLTINPNWFWNTFLEYYEKSFKEVLLAQENNPDRKNCLIYIKEYLLE